MEKKHSVDYRRQWRKLHLGIDAQTLEIRAMEVVGNRTADATMLPGLLAQIPGAEGLVTVTTDGAYDTRLCHAAIAERGAAAIIPLVETTSSGKGIHEAIRLAMSLCVQ